MPPPDPIPTPADLTRRRFLRTAGLAAAAACGAVPALGAGTKSERIRPDRDGMLRIAGRREFILGLYQTPRHQGALREAAAAGFNLVNRSPTAAAYDEARAHGLRGWSAVGSIGVADPGRDEARIRETVEALRGHPALLFWETEDEPTFVWKEPAKHRVPPEQINATAALIRRLDPVHPLYLNQAPTNLVSTLQAYNPGADIVATDIYPVIPRGIRELYALWPDGRQGDFSDDTLAQVGRYADKMRRVAGPRRAVFMVLQGFAWEKLRDREPDPAMVLYPTAAQLRFMAWQSVVHGVNGLVWWGLAYTPPEAPLWTDLQAVVRELASVREALAAPAAKLRLGLTYHDTGHSLDRGIEWMARSTGREMLLIAVNADPNPVEVTFSGLQRFRRCEPVIGGNPAGLGEPGHRERFEPFDTRVWRLS